MARPGSNPGRCNQTPEIGVNLQDGIDEEWKKQISWDEGL